MILFIYIFSLIFLSVFSYGFIDPHLSTSLAYVAYDYRSVAAILFFILLVILFSLYVYFLKHTPKIWIIPAAAGILLFSYPALTYDLFNYITTAKVAFTHGENPYVVMPVEIPNEPNLAFTRAANKFALYGPVWIALTAIPHTLGSGNIWATMFAFKFMNVATYFGFCYFIWNVTKNSMNVIFFALNPLVLIEVIMNGHNDIYMIFLALVALKYKNIFALVASWFIKGATLILAPLQLLKITWEKTLVAAYWLLAFVFFVFAPIREELYPWYAVWLIATASLMNFKSHKHLLGFTMVLSFALELRHLPYMWMGYYEGPGPILRTLLTVIPIALFFVWFVWKKTKLKLF